MKSYLIIASALALAACNQVRGEPLPDSSDSPALAAIGKDLDDDEKKLLIGYLMRREMAKQFGGKTLPDGARTVGDALDAQRKWAADLSESERKAEALKAEVEQKRKLVADQISKAVTVAFIDARYRPRSFDEGQFDNTETFTFAVHNGGAKPIKALKGDAVFIDTFGDEFIRVPMQFEDVVAPGERKTLEFGMEINEFMDRDKKVMQLDKSKKFRFEPEQIVFSDDTTIKAPAQVGQ